MSKPHGLGNDSQTVTQFSQIAV